MKTTVTCPHCHYVQPRSDEPSGDSCERCGREPWETINVTTETHIKLARSSRTSDTIDIMDADGCHFTSTQIDLLYHRATDGIRELVEDGKTVTVCLVFVKEE